MAMRHPKSIVLSGALSALIIMTVSATWDAFLVLIFLHCFFSLLDALFVLL